MTRREVSSHDPRKVPFTGAQGGAVRNPGATTRTSKGDSPRKPTAGQGVGEAVSLRLGASLDSPWRPPLMNLLNRGQLFLGRDGERKGLGGGGLGRASTSTPRRSGHTDTLPGARGLSVLHGSARVGCLPPELEPRRWRAGFPICQAPPDHTAGRGDPPTSGPGVGDLEQRGMRQQDRPEAVRTGSDGAGPPGMASKRAAANLRTNSEQDSEPACMDAPHGPSRSHSRILLGEMTTSDQQSAGGQVALAPAGPDPEGLCPSTTDRALGARPPRPLGSFPSGHTTGTTHQAQSSFRPSRGLLLPQQPPRSALPQLARLQKLTFHVCQ